MLAANPCITATQNAEGRHKRWTASTPLPSKSPKLPQRLTGVPLASVALSVFGFCGFLRKFCGTLRIFSNFCGFFADFCGIFAEFRGILRIFRGILRTNIKGTRAKGHQCEALSLQGGVPPGTWPAASALVPTTGPGSPDSGQTLPSCRSEGPHRSTGPARP